MTQTPEDRPRPTPRPRTAAARPSPRPRVAGSRRDREDGGVAERPAPAPRPTAARRGEPTAGATTAAVADGAAAPSRARKVPALVLVLATLCLLAAAGTGVLLWQRLDPRYVDGSVLAAAGEGVQALYAYDYKDSDGSIRRKLDVLTGDLKEQYKGELSQGGIIDTYEQVSATTKFDLVDVGLQEINPAQDDATVVVFGAYVVKSVNSGTQPAPESSGCQVTPDGAQSCVQTVRVHLVRVDGDWKIDELT
ncbi:hypothetical protein DQ237_06775 [Blastococcus sp. TF02-8]|uniref:hypothetical protein n=1 Tax=Blastococcus sp. TF02-8 TaxID=2250574 RepID=UPI000DE97B07|nr:hypothetical protein [Blastococcus sp. TF02-8]RBY97259.1 hypothetical protein DQ237_06775 [Blastococcus sp. TF02-8]